MALALPASSSVSRVMPVRSSSMKTSGLERLVISTTPPYPTARYDIPQYAQTSASPAESDDPPLTPMVFHPNEDYEKSRLSYYAPPPPRAASSPSSPNDTEEPSPVLFAHPNNSSPTLVLPPLPVFPLSHSIAARSRRPLPALPKVVTDSDGGARQTISCHKPPTVSWRGGRISPFSFGNEIDDRDSDTLTAFSSPSPSSSHSSTSIYTTASSSPPDSANATNGFPRADARPRPLALTIPSRSYSAPLPSKQKVAPFADSFASPHISVTPASPVPPKQFSFHVGGRQRTRTASATSIVIASDPEDDPEPRARPLARSPSPAPSLVPSVSSTTSATKPKSTLRRIASKTRLFGRRKMSTSSDPWGHDDEDTVVGHGSLSLDSGSLRSRSASPLDSCDGAQTCADRVPRSMRRVEIAEATLTPHGDIWEERELDEVIPKLRMLRAPARIKI